MSELLEPLCDLLKQYVLMPGKVHTDVIPVPVQEPGSGKTRTARLWAYVRDDRNAGSKLFPAVWFACSPDRKGIHPKQHLAGDSGILQADAYGVYSVLYEDGHITEAACTARARRKIHDVHVRTPTDITIEAHRLAVRYRGRNTRQPGRGTAGSPQSQNRAADAVDVQMDTYVGEGAFAPLGYGEGVLIPAEAVGCTQGNGWVEIDYNIAENALRGVALGRKNWLFAGSDAGGERASVLYSLIGTCRLNGVDPGAWLRYVIGNIQEWPVNRLRHLLPWKIDLTPAVSAEI